MIDVLIIGGGLAGLTNAILLQKNGYQVSVFEKKNTHSTESAENIFRMKYFPS